MERGRRRAQRGTERERGTNIDTIEKERGERERESFTSPPWRESPSLFLLQSSSSTKTNEISQNKSANPNGRAINAPIGPYRKRQSMGPYDE